MSLQLESLPNMVAGVFSVNNQMQLEATTQIIELLTIGIVDDIFTFAIFLACTIK